MTNFAFSDLSGDDDVYVSDNDDEDLASNEDTKKIGQDHGDKSEDKVNNNGTSAVPSQVKKRTILSVSGPFWSLVNFCPIYVYFSAFC